MEKKRCREKIDTAATFSSSSSKFGSFIFLASYYKFSTPVEPSKTSCIPSSNHSSEHALIMLSSSSSSSSDSDVQSGSEEEESDDHCWWSTGGGGGGGGGGSTTNDHHRMVFKVDNNNNNNNLEDQQQMVFKLDCLGFPPLYKFCYGGVSRRALDPKEIVGSCHGLVCLYDRDNNKVSLWNPLTEQFRILPESITIPSDKEVEVFHPHHQSLVAFGFDVETNDYKVVLLGGFRSKSYKKKISGGLVTTSMIPMDCFCQVQLYSLSTDSWSLVKGGDDGRGIISLPGYPFFQHDPTEVLYLNGSCFFMAHFLHSKHQRCIPENNRFIISFDLTKEIITPIRLPDHHRDQDLYLFSYLGDKIALFTAAAYTKDHAIRINYQDSIHGFFICSDVFDIWVLNEHGSSSSVKMEESWVKLHSFTIERESLYQWNLPRGISNNGDFVLLENMNSAPVVGKKMKLYSLVTKQVEGNFLSCSRVMSKAYPHKPSQVSIIGGNGGAAAADMVIGNGATK